MTSPTPLSLFDFETSNQSPVPTKKSSLPPMLTQYLEYKERFSDYIIMIQVGDFYEIFFDDATKVARILNITLTSRDKQSENPIPMCGVPVGAIDSYLEKLVDAGQSAVIISQIEGAAATKGGVPRSIDRIVTPGVRLFDTKATSESLIASVVSSSDSAFAICWSSVQSGKLWSKEVQTKEALFLELRRIYPAEIIFPSSEKGKAVDGRTSWVKDSAFQCGAVSRHRPDNNQFHTNVIGWSGASPEIQRAARLLLGYIDEVTVGKANLIRELSEYSESEILHIDARTRENLELTKELRSGAKTGTLFEFLDKTSTILGERRLKAWIEAPLKNCAAIEERYDFIDACLNSNESPTLKSTLSCVPDLERIAARIEMGVVTPLELSATREAIRSIPEIIKSLENLNCSISKYLKNELTLLDNPFEILERALDEEPSAVFTEGKVIRDGFDKSLDETRAIREKGRDWITQLEIKEKESTGISSLKLRYTNAFGFFIEITKANISRVPSHYKRKQTTVGGERFTTDELQAKESDIRSAEQDEIKKQREIFESLRQQLIPHASPLRKIANAIGTLDALLSLSEVAQNEALKRPKVNESEELIIEDGAHPVLLSHLGHECIRNSISFTQEENAFILTGPNMGGKSTFLRQIAMIVILAQMGSFVPANNVSLGIVDKLFARIGASDNLMDGESTFMVEMREASLITARATQKSLVLIDELGRGTATTDGVALAQAVFEYLKNEIQCRMILATHFHELTSLKSTIKGVENLSVKVLEEGDTILFPHVIEIGTGDRSYGIEVAKLAGLPESVLDRAAILLDTIPVTAEKNYQQKPATPKLPLQEQKELSHLRKLSKQIKEIEIDNLTPINALQFLAKIRESL